MTTGFDDTPETALRWLKDGRKVALATVVETWGSAPRPTGSQLVISQDAEMVGSVSGGCVEGAVVAEALDALDDGKLRVLTYGVSDDDAFAVGLACGGTIRVLVEPVDTGQGMPTDLLEGLVAARAARTPVIYAVNPDSAERRLIVSAKADPLHEPAEQARIADRSGFSGDWFLGVHNPPLRLIVVGAVHIAQPLMQMARLAGYDAVVVDPRDAFGSASRFPGETILNDWPDDALRNHGIDTRTAVVTLTHDPKLDDPAIEVALTSECFYLGCLGSTRTHAKRVARLTEAGIETARISRIDAPVGLDIGAKSPAEIAVAVLAEMTERLRRPETRPQARSELRSA